MNTQQHLNRLFGDKVASQVTPEVEALRSLWFVLKGHDGSLRRPGSLAGEWVGYSISVVAGAPQFRFFFKHKVPDLTPLHRVVTPFHLKTSDVFGVKFSALSRGTFQRNKSHARVAAHVPAQGSSNTQTVKAGMLLTVNGDLVGTLGAFLKESSSPSIWLLSANHVLAANGSALDAAQSIEFDGSGQSFLTEQVRFTPLLPSSPNVADVAITRLQPGSTLMADAAFLTAVSTTPATGVTAGGKVTRTGEGLHAHPDTSGGEVELAPELEYDSGNCGILHANMENQYLVEGAPGVDFSEPGDSGSLALYQNSVLGMVIANAETIPITNGGTGQSVPENYTVVTPFEDLMDSLNTNLDSGGGELGWLSLYQGPPISIP